MVRWRYFAPFLLVLGAIALTAVAFAAAAVHGRTAQNEITELRWATTSVARLDIASNFSYPANTIIFLGIEQLFKYSPSGKLIPALASAVRQPNATTYVYTIRRGVRFWDGSPLTSADVVYSLNRNRAPISQIAQFYRNVSSVRATGPLQVTVKLKTPDSKWKFTVTNAAPIIQKKFGKANGNDIGTPNVLNMGTGPFKFTSFIPNQSIVMTRNDNWWGGKVAVKKITIQLLANTAAIIAGLRSGAIDGYATRGDDMRPFENIPNTKMTVAPGATPMIVSMNTRFGPWSDVHVRRAVAHLVDRPAIVRTAMGGYAEPLDTLVPPTVLASIATPSQMKAFYNSYRKYPFSVAAAKRELSLSRYPDGFSAQWPVYPVPDAVNSAQVLAANLKQIGINITLDQRPFPQWLLYYSGPREELGIANYTYSTAHPGLLYEALLHSANAREHAGNSAVFRNRFVDNLLARHAGAKTSSGEYLALRDLSKRLADRVPYVVLYTQKNTLVLNSKYSFKGFSNYWHFSGFAASIQD